MPRRSRGRGRRILAVLVLGVLALLVVQAVLVRVVPVDTVVETFTRDLGHPVKVASAELRLLPSPRVVLEGIVMEPNVRMERVDVLLTLGALLGGGLESGRARLRGLHIELVRRADGSLALGRGAAAPDEDEDEDASGSVLPAHISLPLIVLEDVSVRYEDHTAVSGPRTDFVHVRTAELWSRDGALDLELFARLGERPGPDTLHATGRIEAAPEQGRRPFSFRIHPQGLDPENVVPHVPTNWGIRSVRGALHGSLDLAWDAQGVFDGELDLRFTNAVANYAGIELEGDFEFAARLHDEGKPPMVLSRGRARADAARVGVIDARSARADLGYTNHWVTLEALAFEFHGGTVDASGRIGTRPLSFDLELDADGLSVAGLRGEELPADETPMRLDVAGSFAGNWQGGEDWLAPLGGSGRGEIRGGTVPSGELLQSVVMALPRHWPRTGKAKREPWMDRTALQELTASIALRDGRVHTRDLLLVTHEYRIGAEGSIGSRGDYVFDGNLEFTQGGVSRLLRAARVDGRTGERSVLPGVPFRIVGDLGDDSYDVRLAEQPLTTLVVLPWALKEVTSPAGKAVGAARRVFGNGGSRTDDGGETQAPPE